MSNESSRNRRYSSLGLRAWSCIHSRDRGVYTVTDFQKLGLAIRRLEKAIWEPFEPYAMKAYNRLNELIERFTR